MPAPVVKAAVLTVWSLDQHHVIMWELVRNSQSLAPPRSTEPDTLGWGTVIWVLTSSLDDLIYTQVWEQLT